jgi:predicted CopG family antitoxin
MAVNKRIPVSEELWERLGKMKRAGQTYDELIREIIQKAYREDLADRMDEVKEMDEDELTSIEDL